MDSLNIIIPVCFIVGIVLGILHVPMPFIMLIGGVVGFIIRSLVNVFTKGVTK